MKISTAILVIVMSVGISSLLAQTDCSQSLLNAERAYYTGRFDDVQTMLAPCLTSGFDKDQKTEAYRLLALSNIFSRNFEMADSALFLMLKTTPQYEVSAQDPPEFRKRLDKFNARPIVSISLGGGAYLPMMRITKVYNLRNTPSDVKYKSSLGYQFAVGTSFFLSKKVVLEAALEWQSFAFTINNSSDIKDSKGERVETRLEEAQKRNQVMLAAGYNFSLGAVTMRVSGGAAYNTLMKAEGSLYRLELVSGDYVYREDLGFSNLNHRTRHDLRPLILVKASIPQKNNYAIDFFMRYEYGIRNLSRNRDADVTQMLRYEWVEDDFKASYLTLGVSLSKLYYHVKQ